MYKNIFFTIILSSLLNTFVLAQESGPAFNRSGVMDGNNVKTVFGNWGVIGQPMGNYPRGAWMHNSNGYIGDESVLIGLEFPIKDYNNDGLLDTIHSVITCPVSRPAANLDVNPITGDYWTFMPVGASINPASNNIALSSKPETWPLAWSEWKSIPGIGRIPGALESYYQVNDKNDHRFDTPAHNPHNINFTNIEGQGISIDTWYVQLKHYLFRDVLFRVHDMKNTGGLKYSKVFFGYLMGTYVGVPDFSSGVQEYDDDYSILFKKENIVITGDFDNDATRNPFWKGPVGKVGSAFVDAPNNQSIGSFNQFAPSNDIPLADDEILWKRFKQGSYKQTAAVVNDTVVLMGQDADFTMGTDYFSIESGETKRISSVLVYGYSYNEIFMKTTLARVMYNKKFNIDSVGTAVKFKNLAGYTTLNGSIALEWNTFVTNGKADIYFTNDNGITFKQIVKDYSSATSIQWDTRDVLDCAFGRFFIIIKDESGTPIDFNQSAFIKINNEMKGIPQAFLADDIFTEGKLITEKEIPVWVYIGNPEGDSVQMEIKFNTGDGFTKFLTVKVQPDSLPHRIVLNVESLPNSETMTLQFTCKSLFGTTSFTTQVFNKQTPRIVLSEANIQYLSRKTESEVFLSLLDRNIAGIDQYIISFNDTAFSGIKTFRVFNKTKNQTVVENEPLVQGRESSLFNGMRLAVKDISTVTDTLYWNSTVATTRYTHFLKENVDLDFDGNIDYAYAHPCDYRVVFYNEVVDSTTIDNPKKPVKYKVYNVSAAKQAKILTDYFMEGVIHQFYIQEEVLNIPRYTWGFLIGLNGAGIQGGETLMVVTKKGISFYDSLSVSNVALHVNAIGSAIPDDYFLSQNYPNPFNPSTTFEYQIPHRSIISLKIYDAIGREVATLVNEEKSAGIFKTTWNAAGYSTGLYFIRMTSGTYSAVKKLMLIK